MKFLSFQLDLKISPVTQLMFTQGNGSKINEDIMNLKNRKCH